MVKEAWDSFKDNIKERVSNPFLGTFILVWVVYNWRVVYAFFFFDKEYKLNDRIQFFKNYWADKSFFWNLVIVASLAVGILIITYLFLSLSRFLSNIFENMIIPYIQKITKGKLVTMETYQKSLENIQLLEEKVEKERKAKNEAILERDEIEKRFSSSDFSLMTPNKETTKSIVDVDDNRTSIEADFTPLIKSSLSQTLSYKDLERTLLDIDKHDYFITAVSSPYFRSTHN